MGIFKDNWKRYRDLGFIPYPSSKKGKNPLVEWKGGAIPTNDLYNEWERKHPDANPWVYLGNNFAVIDPDGPGAEEYIKSLNLPPCPTSISGNKSIHRFFKVSSPLKPLKVQNGSDQTFLELRTGNMGMLAPPSVHPETGKPYRWAKGLSPWQIPFPELPGEVYEKIKALVPKRIEPKMEPAQVENGSLGSLNIEKYLTHFAIKYKVKPDGQRTIYALERCLFADQHTVKDVEGDSSIIQGSDGKLGYHCFHNHCSFKTWRDARQAISGDKPISEFFRGYNPLTEKDPDWLFRKMKSCALEADQIRVMEFPEKKKILIPWLSERALILVAGWRGVGKTWFALGVCNAISRGESFGPWKATEPFSSLYVDGEMDIGDIQERLKLLGTPGVKKKDLVIYSDFQANSAGLPKTNLSSRQCRDAIKRMALEWGVRVVVLDNIASLCPGLDENSRKDWDPINQWLIDLRFNGISAMLLHHTNKEGGQRGTSAREDNLDISISLDKPHDYVTEDGADFIVRFKKSRIRKSDLPLIADTELKLDEKDGILQWTWGSVKGQTRDEILRMLDEGIPQAEIVKALGIDKGYVSRVRKKAMEDNIIGKNGKLTQAGFAQINAVD